MALRKRAVRGTRACADCILSPLSTGREDPPSFSLWTVSPIVTGEVGCRLSLAPGSGCDHTRGLEGPRPRGCDTPAWYRAEQMDVSAVGRCRGSAEGPASVRSPVSAGHPLFSTGAAQASAVSCGPLEGPANDDDEQPCYDFSFL